MPQIIFKSFDELTAGELHRITQAREQVFFLEQHVTCPDADEVDLRSIFVWMEDAGRVMAFLRIIPAGVVYNEASIGRVLVDAACRRRGLCRALMIGAMDYISTQWGPQPIRISAQQYLAGFYSELGFETVSPVYDEAGIPHVKMLRR